MANMNVETLICLFAFGFFLVVAGRNMPSTPLSSDDVTLHHILSPPPPYPFVNCGDVALQSKPPTHVINCGDVVPQTPPLSKPPSPVRGDVVPKTPSLPKPPSPDVNHDSIIPHNTLGYILFAMLLVFSAFVTVLVIRACDRCINGDL